MFPVNNTLTNKKLRNVNSGVVRNVVTSSLNVINTLIV